MMVKALDGRNYPTIILRLTILVSLAACEGVAQIDQSTGLGAVAGALPSRLLEARLSIRQPAEGCVRLPGAIRASCSVPEPGSRDYSRLTDVTALLQTHAMGQPPAQRAWAEGLVLLLWSPLSGNAGEAVERLRDASRLKPGDPDLAADLSAAHLEAGRQPGGEWHIPRALETALAALELDPDHLPGRYNLFLALEAMGLAPQATEERRTYLGADPYSAWAGAVRQSIEEADFAPRASRSAVDLEEMVDPDEAIPEEHVRTFALGDPQAARTLAMDRMLPAWAELAGRGDAERSSRLFERLRVIAAELTDQSVTYILRDVDNLVHGGDASAFSRLQAALTAFGEARQAYIEVDDQKAGELFVEASLGFDGTVEVLGLWSDFWLANTALGLLEYQRGEALVESLLRRVPPRTPTLLGLTQRVAGVISGRQGHMAQASAHYQAAIASLSQSGESGYLASLWGAEAEMRKVLGSPREAWHGRIRALRIHAAQGRPESHPILHDAADAASQEGLERAAVRIQNSVLAVAQAMGTPEYIAEAYIRRGRYHLSRGDTARGLSDSDSAAAMISLVTTRRMSDWMEADLLRLRASAMVTNPRGLGEAIALLDSAATAHRDAGHDYFLASILLERSRLAWRAGRPEVPSQLDEAQRLLRVAIEDAASPADRVRFAETARDFVDLVGEMVAADRVDPQWALFAVDGLSTFGRQLPSVGGDRGAMPSVPPGIAILRYLIIPESLVIWTLTDEGLAVAVESVEQSVLEQAVDGLRAIVRSVHDLSLILAQSTKVRSLVLPDIVLARTGSRDLIVVPGGSLTSIPFALLPGVDAPILLQERTVSIAHSMASALGAAAQTLGPTGPPLRAAIIGLSSPVPALDLPALPGVEDELRLVGEMYPGAAVLLDEQATRSRFLTEITQSTLLHFAGHAVSGTSQGLGSYLLLHPDLSGDGTGRIYATDLFSLDGNAPETVVLTACSSTSPDGTTSGGFWGVGLPLLQSGSRFVVGTLWDVPDREAAAFSVMLHKKLREGTLPTMALREAQREALAAGLLPPRAWGAFQVLVGGWSPTSPAG